MLKMFLMRTLLGYHDHAVELESSISDATCVITEEIGCNPASISGKHYNPTNGTIYLVRLNHSHSGNGTLPQHPKQDQAFAATCAEFVKRSSGCSHWIIGNEPNLNVEKNVQPDRYAKVFNLCQRAIKAVQPNATVIVAGSGPWNTQTTYASNPAGDWIEYFKDVLNLTNPDGIAIHTYSDGHNPDSITLDAFMQPPFNHRRYGFRTYIDYMTAIPERLRNLPVWITETNPNDAWIDSDKEWIRRAYAEIDRWNQLKKQQIRSLCLYRWIDHDKWSFKNKPFVRDALIEVAQRGYQWRDMKTNPQPETPTAEAEAPTAEAEAPTVAVEVQPEVPDVEIGVSIKVLRDTNLRLTPGFVGKDEKDIITVLKPDDTAEVVSDARIVDGLNWLKVKVFSTNGSNTGWLADTAPNGLPLVVVIGSEFTIGERVEACAHLNVRGGPGRFYGVTRRLNPGDQLTLEDGPKFADGLIWWLTGIGWCAESVNGVALIGKPKTNIIDELASTYGIDAKVVKAVIGVESGGSGFGPDGKVLIRFEPHVFLSKLTDSRQRESFGELFEIGEPTWDGNQHKVKIGDRFESFHGNQNMEYKTLNIARAINDDAAMQSISIGLPQLMSFNYAKLGYGSPQEMYSAFQSGEDEQVRAMFVFMDKSGAIDRLKAGDLLGFASIYNGSGQKQHYAKLIEKAIGA